MIKLSIIVPCFNEEKNVRIFTQRVEKVMNSTKKLVKYEIIFVDDASTDNTVSEIRKFIEANPQHRLIINQRNYGVYRSSFAALKFAKGDWVIPMMPIDLQDPPEVIPKFVAEIEDGIEVIAGARYERNEIIIMKFIRRLYYKFVSKFAGYDIPPYVGEFQLVSRKIVDQLVQVSDYYPYTRALIAKQVSIKKIIPYTWEKRSSGKSKHNLVKLYDQAINGIVTTSIAPLRFMMLAGLLISVFCFVIIAIQVLAFFTFSRNTFSPGIPTLIVTFFFCFGIVFIFLGLIGEYIAAIHSQVRNNYSVQSKEFSPKKIR
jgi:glycosyltransferase involved in cell wall biosynthesis